MSLVKKMTLNFETSLIQQVFKIVGIEGKKVSYEDVELNLNKFYKIRICSIISKIFHKNKD